MRLQGSKDARGFAKKLRREMTPPEIALWNVLRRHENGLRFRRQHPAGDYILDFYCAPARLVIEIDGEAHNLGDRPDRDAKRDAWLVSQGLRVLRYPAAEALGNLDGVVSAIMSVAVGRAPSQQVGRHPPPPSASRPPPPGGGGFST